MQSCHKIWIIFTIIIKKNCAPEYCKSTKKFIRLYLFFSSWCQVEEDDDSEFHYLENKLRSPPLKWEIQKDWKGLWSVMQPWKEKGIWPIWWRRFEWEELELKVHSILCQNLKECIFLYKIRIWNCSGIIREPLLKLEFSKY